MKLPMAVATFALVVGAFALTACGQSDTPVTQPTQATTTPAAAPTTPANIALASDLVGDWQDVKAEWTVHFKDDGTYVEDFQGNDNFRVGKYDLVEGTVSLIGDDGNTDKGAVEGQSLAFKLGTLTRK